MIKQHSGASRAVISAAVLAAAMTATLALGGCGKGADGQAAKGVAASAQPPAGMVKLNAYTEAHNDLLGNTGLIEIYKTYNETDIPNQSAQSALAIADGYIDGALEKLEKARALPGGSAALDKAADTLIANLHKLMARLGPLKIYYDSQAYREDGLTRGKAEDPLLKADFQTAITDLQVFSDALDVERRKGAAAALAGLKARGDMLTYNSKLALQQGESLIRLFKRPEDVSDPAVLAKGDALVAELEKTLADQREAYAAAKLKTKDKTPIEQPDYNYVSAADKLTSLIGDYRNLKQSRKPEAFEAMTTYYNDAVEYRNRLRV